MKRLDKIVLRGNSSPSNYEKKFTFYSSSFVDCSYFPNSSIISVPSPPV